MNALDLAIFRAKVARHVPLAPKLVPKAPIPSAIIIPIKQEVPPDLIEELRSKNHLLEQRVRMLERYVESISYGAALDFSRPHIRQIVKAVALHYRVSINDILGERRTSNIMLPRHVAIYLAKQLTLFSLPAIGAAIGKRDHTTILHAVRRIANLRQISPEIDTAIVQIQATLKSTVAALSQVAGETA